MGKRRMYRWLALLGMALALVIGAIGIYWYISPKLMLTSALPRLFSHLEERFQGDPMLILADTFNTEGKYTADMVLQVNREITGPVTFEGIAQTDAKAHCFFAGGTVRSSERTINASLYLDRTFGAVSSEDLVEGNYYGITYDTFASDIRSMPILSPFVSDQVLSQWTDSVQFVKEAMDMEYLSITLPDLSKEDIKTMLLGIAAMPYTRETVSASINGETLSCLKLDYSFDGRQLEDILSASTGETYPTDTAVCASFYLFDTSLVRFLIQYQQGSTSCFYNFTFGKDPLHDPLTLQGTECLPEASQTYSLCIDTVRKENRLEQTLRYVNDQSEPLEYAYEWENATGTMYLKTDAVPTPVKLRLFRVDTGLQVETADFGGFIGILTRRPQIADVFEDVKCTMVIQNGSDIMAPDYKNLDDWSFNDFLILIGGLGSLIGFPFNN